MGSYFSSNASWGLVIFSVVTSNRANKLQKIPVWFRWLYNVHFSLVVHFISQKLFQQFYISLRLLFWSIEGNKSFLAYAFKLKRKLASTLARALKSEIILLRLARQTTWYAVPDWTHRFLTREKSNTRDLIGLQLPGPACEPKFISRLFSG